MDQLSTVEELVGLEKLVAVRAFAVLTDPGVGAFCGDLGGEFGFGAVVQVAGEGAAVVV